jgi:hypothetical protein
VLGTVRRTRRSKAFSRYSSSFSPPPRTSFHAVHTSTAPNRKKTHVNEATTAAPSAMNAVRITSASSTPTSSTR